MGLENSKVKAEKIRIVLKPFGGWKLILQ